MLLIRRPAVDRGKLPKPASGMWLKPESSGQTQHICVIQVDHTSSSGQVSAIAGAPVAGGLRKDRYKTPFDPLKTGFGTPHPT